jgi:hypothetical protein
MYLFKENDNVYNWISCLIPNRIYFGPFPNQLLIDKLLKENFDLIVNLTCEDEIIYNDIINKDNIVYNITKKNYINFPIKDNEIPDCLLTYCNFIHKLKEYFSEGKKLYIHCRGGHGRSSMICVSLLYLISMGPTYNNECNFFNIIKAINISHNNRQNIRIKWKKRNMPFNSKQYFFLLKIHKDIYISVNNYKNKFYQWIYIKEPVIYKDFVFPSLFDLFLEENIDFKEKYEIITQYFVKKLKNKDVNYKFQLTYLRKFTIIDSKNEYFSKIVNQILCELREKYYKI